VGVCTVEFFGGSKHGTITNMPVNPPLEYIIVESIDPIASWNILEMDKIVDIKKERYQLFESDFNNPRWIYAFVWVS
jgi:hypothetical protein